MFVSWERGKEQVGERMGGQGEEREGDRRKERRIGCKREGECDEDEQRYREGIVSPVSYRRK